MRHGAAHPRPPPGGGDRRALRAAPHARRVRLPRRRTPAGARGRRRAHPDLRLRHHRRRNGACRAGRRHGGGDHGPPPSGRRAASGHRHRGSPARRRGLPVCAPLRDRCRLQAGPGAGACPRAFSEFPTASARLRGVGHRRGRCAARGGKPSPGPAGTQGADPEPVAGDAGIDPVGRPRGQAHQGGAPRLRPGAAPQRRGAGRGRQGRAAAPADRQRRGSDTPRRATGDAERRAPGARPADPRRGDCAGRGDVPPRGSLRAGALGRRLARRRHRHRGLARWSSATAGRRS